VEGGDRTLKQQVKVNQEDKLEQRLLAKTMMWNTFMTQGQEGAYVALISFDKILQLLENTLEEVIDRCNKILTQNGVVDMNDTLRAEVNQSNVDFGAMGERVLAFAYLDLDQNKFNGDYKFDMKGWKSFGEAYKGVSYSSYADQPGAFPMHDLVLCGVASLNDPPRPKVDLSVDKCRQAGIKVIMVTGDQPPTAAAIAEKVNIIKHPDREYSRLIKNGMPEEKAME